MWNAAPINAGDILNLHDIKQTLENLKRVSKIDNNHIMIQIK
jgi:hemolysin activation/secretion protein